MSILASLAKAYDRLPGVPAPGYSTEKIGFVISLNDDGSVASVTDLRDGGKKNLPRMMQVPQPPKKASSIKPNSLWEKTPYALGVTARADHRTAAEHASFKEWHRVLLGGADDPGLLALRRFLERWSPRDFLAPIWPEDMKDQSVVFAYEPERSAGFLHDRTAAKLLLANKQVDTDEPGGQICLVSGTKGAVARLHPSIKGVWGGQTSGGSIVAFNEDSFESYGHKQGDNAAVSELATFKYTTALNTFLAGKTNRLQVGDASTVFWADASDVQTAEVAESVFGSWFNDIDETVQAGKVGAILKRIRDGVVWEQAVHDIAPGLEHGVRFYVLGLAPNAARISIRFWFEDDFGTLAEHYQRFVSDMMIDPPPRDGYPPLWRYLNETAVLGKRENVQPNLAGEWMRAILGGTRYPLTLLSAVIVRVRADGKMNALRAAIIKAVLIRNFEWSATMALDPDNKDPAYLLGRLFAVLERFQELALGTVNASIRDRYYGSASAAPRVVFPLLLRLNLHHKSKAEKGGKRGLAGYFDKQMAEIINGLGSDFPPSLSLRDQGKFTLGYYHQYNRRKASDGAENIAEEDATP